MSRPDSADWRVVLGHYKTLLSAPDSRTYHEDGPSTVKPGAVPVLPDIFNIVCVPPNVLFPKLLEYTFNSFGVAFQSTFTPTDMSIFCLNSNEQPPRRDSESLLKSYVSIICSNNITVI